MPEPLATSPAQENEGAPSVTRGVSRERQTLFWLRDELWRHSHTTVSISPQAAKKMADEINAVLCDEPGTRDRKPRF